MNAKRLIRQAAVDLIRAYPIEKLSTKRIVDTAEVSKQTFYRYYTDKYELANKLYAEPTQEGIVVVDRACFRPDWKQMYRRQFRAFRENLDFMQHPYSSRETGCTLDYEIKSTMHSDKGLLARNGASIRDPRIAFAIQAKDVDGTWMMRDWILGGMQATNEEIVTRFELIIPVCLAKYYWMDEPIHH
ncbi:TetR/AcrR family transcriptional regulator [Olsenella sp. Marseille-P4559]|uniref:TetR/AcrR family transcriptional regulator n=1 Tax=Olsenella sp. Marseille-P4559 TaxID=2364795 RepID=UPI0010314496|nr:TetR family transcriptional regulator [Olsenella sp. Marseille-P4559]